MNTFLSSVSRLLTVLLLGAGLLVVPGQTATAQMSSDTLPNLIQHLRSELQSDNATRREHALVDVVALSNCPDVCTVHFRSAADKKLRIENDTGTGLFDLGVLVPDLLEAYRSGPADGHRLLALSALINIGDEKALQGLIRKGAFQSEKTNRATHRSLAAFYLEKYPELAEQTLETGQLSMEDVRRAKALRVRQVKN